MHGAYHALGWAKPGGISLADFAYSFIRRFGLPDLVARLIPGTARCVRDLVCGITAGLERIADQV